MIYHVAKSGADSNPGTNERPFLSIGKAALTARPGDTVIVHKGVYREWVNPQEGGRSNIRRITYQAAEGEPVTIKGSERIQSWKKTKGTVWSAVLPNSFFGHYNPYLEKLQGDWLVYPIGRSLHPGNVYLNGMSFYEAENFKELENPVVRITVLDRATQEYVEVKNPEQTKYVWYATVDDSHTTIYANFHEADPNKELVEINVRPCCFFPEKTGVNYITVRGFEMAHAASQWAPPTANQPGLMGANWSKGWIIENNVIHDSKCSAISIGKEISTGDNFRTSRKDKPGYQYQLESVFAASKSGWSKEKIGSHIIRNNVIYDCGQNAVVGHLGCVFSEIYNNTIYNIGIKREFFGHEIAGIKLHAAIDVQIHHNHIHDCSLGIWLDWQAQGTRLSKNCLYQNTRDVFLEVNHGPYIVDHNILGSKNALEICAQGGAFIRNLIAGKVISRKELDRATPYHAPHSTEITGYAMVYAGDDRMYQNLFIGDQTDLPVGTHVYNGSTTSLEEYIDRIEAINQVTPGDLEIFETVEQPVSISHNVYFNGARAFERESDKLEMPDFDPEYSITEIEGQAYLNLTLPKEFDSFLSAVHTSASLGRVRIVDADFENPDGSAITFDSDYLDSPITGPATCGPIQRLHAGKNRIKL